MTQRKSRALYVHEVAEILRQKYQDYSHHNKRNPLDELLFIICSVKRSEIVYLRAFRTLKQAFPRFEDLVKASTKKLVSRVSWGGLQKRSY